MRRKMVLERTIFRDAGETDIAAIHAVTARAFGRTDEAVLAEALILAPVETITTVAELDGQVVGTVIFSALGGAERALALAPLAVDPNWRDYMIGTELVRHSLTACCAGGWHSVFVLGDPVFYGRFGFRSDLADTADVPWQGPAFQAVELQTGALAGWSGKLDYPPAFGAA